MILLAFQHFKMKYNLLYDMEVKREMSNVAAKTASNIFYQVRCTASTHNEESKEEGMV